MLFISLSSASETDYVASKASLGAIRNGMQEETAGCKPCSALWKGQTHYEPETSFQQVDHPSNLISFLAYSV